MNNPGIGLQITACRIKQEDEKSETTTPPCYGIIYSLSERENCQNALISQRYINNDWNNLRRVGNPGIGLRMTASRIRQEDEKSGTTPHCYDISYSLSEREKYQNALISQRYINNGWHNDGRIGKSKFITS